MGRTGQEQHSESTTASEPRPDKPTSSLSEPQQTASEQLAIVHLAFAEATRKLGLIHSATESVRARAATVLATATAVGGFVGGLAVDGAPRGWQWSLAAGGLIAYLVSIGAALQALLPQKDAWEVGQNTAALARASASANHRYLLGRLATRYQQSFDECEAGVKKITDLVRLAAIAMVIELVFLACLLALTATPDAQPLPAEAPTASTQAPVPPTTSTTTTTQPPATLPPATTS
jgi:hypothetical protein